MRQEIITKALTLPNFETTVLDSTSVDVWQELYTYPNRHSYMKLVVIRNAQFLELERLDNWFAKCKRVAAILETPKSSLATPKGIHIDCSNNSLNRRKPMAEWLSQRYGLGTSQVRRLMEYCHWHISDALSIFDKCKLLQGVPSIKAVDTFMTADIARSRFLTALAGKKVVEAVNYIPKLSAADTSNILADAENLVLLLAKIKDSNTGVKKPYELATDVGTDTATVSALLPVSRLYDTACITRCALALAQADIQWNKGNRIGVLETLVRTWG